MLITTPARTALDLAALGRTDLMDLMLREGWFDRDLMWQALQRGAGRRGWSTAREALTACDTRPFSAAERLAHRLLTAAGITGWEANVPLRLGGRVVIPDLLFDQHRLIVEIDGRAHHSDDATFESDRARHNLLVAHGYVVLRFTWAQLTRDPDGCIEQLRSTLARLAAQRQA